MKKAIILILAISSATIISSCKKDRLCRCIVESTGFINATFTADTTFTDISKKDAEAKCTAQNSSIEEPITNTTVETTCELN